MYYSLFYKWILIEGLTDNDEDRIESHKAFWIENLH